LGCGETALVGFNLRDQRNQSKISLKIPENIQNVEMFIYFNIAFNQTRINP